MRTVLPPAPHSITPTADTDAARMRSLVGNAQRLWPWVLTTLALAALATAAIVRADLAHQRDSFDTDARITHRLLSQRAVQHDAILATLALLQPVEAGAPEQRLPALYPQVQQVLRRDGPQRWPDAALERAETQSRQQRRAVLARADFAQGNFTVLRAADPTSFALRIDLATMVPWAEWPLTREGPVRAALEHAGQVALLQAGAATDAPLGERWRLTFSKHLAAESQPFDLQLARPLTWAALPWASLLAAWLVLAAAAAALFAWQQQRQARHRAEELLRLGQVGRLNALGELAAGMAHELNQPLTAVLASTQAAQRLLAEEPPELTTAREALGRSVEQARRASAVVGRLRHVVQRGDGTAAHAATALGEAVRRVLYLLQPECRRLQVRVEVTDECRGAAVAADAVALEQIVHNLLQNALQALQQVPSGQRRLALLLRPDGPAQWALQVHDSGPGLAPEVLPRLFQPFFTTRSDGMGLGLSLCDTLASSLGGRLSAGNHSDGGALFTLTLPAAAAAGSR